MESIVAETSTKRLDILSSLILVPIISGLRGFARFYYSNRLSELQAKNPFEHHIQSFRQEI